MQIRPQLAPAYTRGVQNSRNFPLAHPEKHALSKKLLSLSNETSDYAFRILLVPA